MTQRFIPIESPQERQARILAQAQSKVLPRPQWAQPKFVPPADNPFQLGIDAGEGPDRIKAYSRVSPDATQTFKGLKPGTREEATVEEKRQRAERIASNKARMPEILGELQINPNDPNLSASLRGFLQTGNQPVGRLGEDIDASHRPLQREYSTLLKETRYLETYDNPMNVANRGFELGMKIGGTATTQNIIEMSKLNPAFGSIVGASRIIAGQPGGERANARIPVETLIAEYKRQLGRKPTLDEVYELQRKGMNLPPGVQGAADIVAMFAIPPFGFVPLETAGFKVLKSLERWLASRPAIRAGQLKWLENLVAKIPGGASTLLKAYGLPEVAGSAGKVYKNVDPSFVKGLNRENALLRADITRGQKAGKDVSDLYDQLAGNNTFKESLLEQFLSEDQLDALHHFEEAFVAAEIELSYAVSQKIVRPKWATGLTDQELRAVAEHESMGGRVLDVFQKDWADSIDSVVKKEALAGYFKIPDSVTKAKLKMQVRHLKHAIEEMEDLADEAAGYVAPLPPPALPYKSSLIDKQVEALNTPEPNIGEAQTNLFGDPVQTKLMSEASREGGSQLLNDPNNLAARQAREEAIAQGQGDIFENAANQKGLFNGLGITYTGKTDVIDGKRLYEVIFAEGARANERSMISQAPTAIEQTRLASPSMGPGGRSIANEKANKAANVQRLSETTHSPWDYTTNTPPIERGDIVISGPVIQTAKAADAIPEGTLVEVSTRIDALVSGLNFDTLEPVRLNARIQEIVARNASDALEEIDDPVELSAQRAGQLAKNDALADEVIDSRQVSEQIEVRDALTEEVAAAVDVYEKTLKAEIKANNTATITPKRLLAIQTDRIKARVALDKAARAEGITTDAMLREIGLRDIERLAKDPTDPLLGYPKNVGTGAGRVPTSRGAGQRGLEDLSNAPREGSIIEDAAPTPEYPEAIYKGRRVRYTGTREGAQYQVIDLVNGNRRLISQRPPASPGATIKPSALIDGGEPVVAQKGMSYRGFSRPAEAIGADKSSSQGVMALDEAYGIEFKSVGGETLGPAHGSDVRGAVAAEDVTKVFFDPSQWDESVRLARIAEDLPEMHKMFPNAEFVQVMSGLDNPENLVVVPRTSAALVPTSTGAKQVTLQSLVNDANKVSPSVDVVASKPGFSLLTEPSESAKIGAKSTQESLLSPPELKRQEVAQENLEENMFTLDDNGITEGERLRERASPELQELLDSYTDPYGSADLQTLYDVGELAERQGFSAIVRQNLALMLDDVPEELWDTTFVRVYRGHEIDVPIRKSKYTSVSMNHATADLHRLVIMPGAKYKQISPARWVVDAYDVPINGVVAPGHAGESEFIVRRTKLRLVTDEPTPVSTRSAEELVVPVRIDEGEQLKFESGTSSIIDEPIEMSPDRLEEIIAVNESRFPNRSLSAQQKLNIAKGIDNVAIAEGGTPRVQSGGYKPPPPPPPPKTIEGTPGGELPSGKRVGGPQNAKPRIVDDPLAQLRTALQPSTESWLMGVIKQIPRLLIDRVGVLQDIQDATGVPAYFLARQVPSSGRIGEEITRVRYKPIFDAVGKDSPRLEEYMVLMRMYDESLKNPTPLLPGGVDGTSEVLAALKMLEKELGTPFFMKLRGWADELWVLNREEVLDEALSTGFIDSAGHTRLARDGEHYITLARDDFEDLRSGAFSARAEGSVSKTPFRAMEPGGSERSLSSPLERLSTQAINMQRAKAKNETGKAIVAGLKKWQAETGEILVKEITPTDEARMIERVTGENLNIKDGAEHSAIWDTISYYEDGVRHTVEIPAEYARAAKGLDTENSHWLPTFINWFSQPLKKGATIYNPAFPVVNLARDQFAIAFNAKGIPLGPEFWKGLWSSIRRDANYTDWVMRGGAQGGIIDVMRGTANPLKRKSLLGTIELNKASDVYLLLPRIALLPVRGVGRSIERVNIAVEQASGIQSMRMLQKRMPQAFDTPLQEQFANLEMIVRSKEARVDFAKMGDAMRTINQIFPFANAATQGTHIVLRTMKNHPGRAGAFTLAASGASILVALNNMRYESSGLIPARDFQRHWPVQIGEGTRSDGSIYPIVIKMPKGEIMSLLTFPAEAMLNSLRDTEDRGIIELLFDGGLAAITNMSPINMGAGGMGFAPPIIKTSVGLVTGQDPYTGLPIVPLAEQNLPPEQQFGAATSKTAIALGKAAHVSPRKIDFAIRDFTANAGASANYLLSQFLELVGYDPKVHGADAETEPQPEGIEKLSKANPVLRPFIGTNDSQEEIRGWETFNEAIRDTQREFNTLPEVNGLGIKLNVANDEIKYKDETWELTPMQRARYQDILGETINRRLEEYLNSPAYNYAEDEVVQKIASIKKVKADAAEEAKIVMLEELVTGVPVDQAQSTAPSTPSPTATPTQGTPDVRIDMNQLNNNLAGVR